MPFSYAGTKQTTTFRPVIAALCNMTKHIQNCISCGRDSEGELYHLGFSDMGCMYCDSCPSVLLLKDHSLAKRNGIEWPNLSPGDEGWEYYNRHLIPVYQSFEKLFKPCHCGGVYKAYALPRCSKCNGYIFGGNPEPDKPINWQNRRHVFVATNSVVDKEQVRENVA